MGIGGDFFEGHHHGKSASFARVDAEADARSQLGIGKSLWLPIALVDSAANEWKFAEKAREEAEREKRETEEFTKKRSMSQGTKLDRLVEEASAYEPGPYDVQVFSNHAILAVADSWKTNADRSDRKEMSQALFEKMIINNGFRQLVMPQHLTAAAMFENLRHRFPNFEEAIVELECAWALGQASGVAEWSFPPLLFSGPPGIGKTMFVEAFSAWWEVPMETIDGATAQGSFELTGNSSFWGNAAPGRVFNMLADGYFANPVLLVDELDKAGGDTRYPFAEGLLQLLEQRTARRFEDSCMRTTFNASKLMTIATCNDADRISQPLLSRMQVVSIPTPNAAQRLQMARMITGREADAISTRIEVTDSAICSIAESDVSPREMRKIVRRALAKAILGRRDKVASIDIGPRCGRQKVGFV